MLIPPCFHNMHFECLHKFEFALTEQMAKSDLHQKLLIYAYQLLNPEALKDLPL